MAEGRTDTAEPRPGEEPLMFRVLRRLAGLGLLALGVAAVVFLVGMRTKKPVVVDAVRKMNRSFMNPKQLESAGEPGAYASVIHHVGRTSGREYHTPIGATRTDEGFVVGLPYGSQVDWLQNLLVSGSATLTHEGEVYRIEQPEVVSMSEVAADFSPTDQKAHRLFAVDEALRVVDAGRVEEPAAAAS